jgi:hypothetical protein
MHAPSLAGAELRWQSPSGATHPLAPVTLEAELQYQQALEEAAWGRLPRPGHPARAEAVAALLAMVNANEFAFGGPAFHRWVWTFAGQAHYLHFLMDAAWKLSQGRGPAPVPRAEVEQGLRAETAAGAGGPFTELWLRVAARDFPFPQTPGDPTSGGRTEAAP